MPPRRPAPLIAAPVDTAPVDAAPVDLAVTSPALPSLTGLRWLAALVVFGHHLWVAQVFSGPAQVAMLRLFSTGGVGVSLFFILSGVVLTWADRPGVPARTFWRRRLARVYPSHLVAVVIAVVLGATLLPRIATPDPVAVAADVALVSSWWPEWWQAGNPVSWTLVCEAFFYAVFPVLVPLVRRASPRALTVALGAASALVVVVALLSPMFPSWLDLKTTPLLRLPEFVVGMVVGRLVRTGAWRGPGVVASAVVAAGGYLAGILLGAPFSTAAATVVGFSCLLAAAAHADISGRSRVLSSRVLVRLGEISFAFYLVHVLVIGALAALWPGAATALPLGSAALFASVALTASIAAGWLLHTAVEKPAQRLIAGRRRDVRTSATGSGSARSEVRTSRVHGGESRPRS